MPELIPTMKTRKSARLSKDHGPLVRYLASLPHDQRMACVAGLEEGEQRELKVHWRVWARDGQLPPAGEWLAWLIMAGRGYGKTRAGTEWVRSIVERTPDARLALVAATLGEARSVMVEGESGLMAVCPPGMVPEFEPSLRRLKWPNGAQAMLYSAQEPDSLTTNTDLPTRLLHSGRPASRNSR